MKKITITEMDIKGLATPQSYQRGLDLYVRGAVSGTYQQGDAIFGLCEGSETDHYKLEIDFGGDDLGASCSCPYAWGGLCKHLVALLLTYIEEEDKFVEPLDIATLLEPLDREDMIIFISELAQKYPDLQFWLQKFIQSKNEAGGYPSKTE